jgi:hypothetical protein
MIDKLNEILKGIDKDQCDSSDGWWETSCGAEFSAKKLKEVQDLVKKLTTPVVSTRLFGVYDRNGNLKSTWKSPYNAFKEATYKNKRLGTDEYFINWVIVG